MPFCSWVLYREKKAICCYIKNFMFLLIMNVIFWIRIKNKKIHSSCHMWCIVFQYINDIITIKSRCVSDYLKCQKYTVTIWHAIRCIAWSSDVINIDYRNLDKNWDYHCVTLLCVFYKNHVTLISDDGLSCNMKKLENVSCVQVSFTWQVWRTSQQATVPDIKWCFPDLKHNSL